jgi:hypothetical protein
MHAAVISMTTVALMHTQDIGQSTKCHFMHGRLVFSDQMLRVLLPPAHLPTLGLRLRWLHLGSWYTLLSGQLLQSLFHWLALHGRLLVISSCWM